MTDYFAEFSSHMGKGLPSPVDTPYETPSFIRSKRSSRATAGGSSREQSPSPPPLPLPSEIDFQDKGRDGRNGFSGVDPRRFTPTLHASLVSEILNLRRELDSKNHLVEDLEGNLAHARSDNDAITKDLTRHAKEVKKAKREVQQIEKGTYDAVESLAQERDTAQQMVEDLKTKLDTATKRARLQDEDAVRTQGIWEGDKESWENERRQLERRVHVTENRLRTFVDEMSAQQAAVEAQDVHPDETGEGSYFKDSAMGQGSDTASIISAASPGKHRRNTSGVSSRTRSMRFSNTSIHAAGTPEPNGRSNGYSLADELDIDEEDEFDGDDYEQADEELEDDGSKPQTTESRQGSMTPVMSPKAKRASERYKETPTSPASPASKVLAKTPPTVSEPFRASVVTAMIERFEPQIAKSVSSVQYVDAGYQPSPPSSPTSKTTSADLAHPSSTTVVPMILESLVDRKATVALNPAQAQASRDLALPVTTATQVAESPISPPQTPVMGGMHFVGKSNVEYSAVSTQTDDDQTQAGQPKPAHTPKSDNLSLPMFVPAIAIHPPTSRPSSPRPYMLPPGTRNAACQGNLSWTPKDAAMQTEEIRVDKRLKISQDFLRSRLLPSPTLAESHPPRTKRTSASVPRISTKITPILSLASPTMQSPSATSPPDSSPDVARDGSSKNLRSLRALPLPRPVLSPVDVPSEGPLNRSSQYGVTRPLQSSSQLADMDRDSDRSDDEGLSGDLEAKDSTGAILAKGRAPHGRYGLSEPPKVVPEHKEISPERRPGTAESYSAAPAPSVASSVANTRSNRNKATAKLTQHAHHRSRSPSFGSFASSSFSKESIPQPPYPIPIRSSSRPIRPKTYSEGSNSPTPQHADMFGRGQRRVREESIVENGLRKVRSATGFRSTPRKISPNNKRRRRRRSPDLTPVQSMAFDTPEPTQFPIPELPTPLQDTLGYPFPKKSTDSKRSDAGLASETPLSQETVLVNAIAATMVGEWMWKYIRKRKSFGIGEETSDFPHTSHTGQVTVAAHGTRHKRWVWLSPYERTIMWDTKQPTSGTALLGKKGRKFAIQSVLDVQDNTPTPKGADLDSAFKRSILILTPARALKFTAVSHERHLLWMTALSFLAQSPSGPMSQTIPRELPAPLPPARAPPPVPGAAAEQSNQKYLPAFGRASLRDSVRLAKGRQGSIQQVPANTDATPTGPDNVHVEDQGADFPAVPRLYSGTTRHQRKRSNTSPKLPAPLSSFRNFSASAVGVASAARLHPSSSTTGHSLRDFRASSSSKSGSARESLTSPDRPNFFEAVGTLRMEAFVDPSVIDNVIYVPAPHQMRRQRGESTTSTSDKRRAGYVFDEFGLDPFKGF